MIKQLFLRIRSIEMIILTAFVLTSTAAYSQSFKEDYDSAVQAFRSAKSNQQVIEISSRFHQLSLRDDAGMLKANAIYWEGECWFHVQDYLRALQSFEKVLVFPNSYKEEAARYMVVSCQVRLGNSKTARWEAERFLKDYPDSGLKNAITKELNRLKP